MPQRNYHYSKIQSLLKELDWDSIDASHDKDSLGLIHWYPATFISNVPANLIELFSNPKELVWDPFCGAGNVGLEAIKRNRKFIGNDCNHIAVKISKAKLTLFSKHEKIEDCFAEVKSLLKDSLWSKKNSTIRSSFNKDVLLQLMDWYNNRVFEKLLYLHSIIFQLQFQEDINNFFEVLFLSIARLSNAQQKTWGHIANNVKPRQDEIDNRNNIDPIKLFIDRTSKVLKKIKSIGPATSALIYNVEEASTTNVVLPQKSDLIVTSPPYPWMCDYTTSQRLSLYWLNYSITQIDEIKQSEIGARYRRKQSGKAESYTSAMIKCFQNIHSNMNDGAKLCLVYPVCDESSLRGQALLEVINYLRSLFKFEASVVRHLEKYKRSSPFYSMDSEIITIWGR